MREVAPCDLVLSFKDTMGKAVGVATVFCFESPNPAEFGFTGMNGNWIGWKVPVHWNILAVRLRPSKHTAQLAPLLPCKYAPLRVASRDQQAVYLAAIPQPMVMMLATSIGPPPASNAPMQTSGFA